MAMMEYIGKTVGQSNNGWGQQFPLYIQSATLAANTDTSVTVPDDVTAGAFVKSKAQYMAEIKFNPATNALYLASGAAAAAPAGGGAFAATTSTLVDSGDCYMVTSGDVLHFKSPIGQTPSVTIKYHQVV